MVMVGDQIFIEVVVEATEEQEKHVINRDIRDASHAERIADYKTLSKAEVVNMLEKIGGFKI